MTTILDLHTSASQWVLDKLDNFDPLQWTEKKAAYTRRKAFAELAIYAYVQGEDLHPNIDEFITRIANHPDYHRLLRRNPRQLLLYSAPIAYVIDKGNATPATIDTLDSVLECPQVYGVERSAHRLMDLWQFLTLVDRRPEWLTAEGVLKLSALAHSPSAFDCTLSEAYALTHDVLFLKNFGVEDPRFADAGPWIMDPLHSALMIARFMAEGNSDIVLELLMCLGMMDQLHGEDAKMVLDWALSRNADQQFIVGPSFDPDAELAYSGLDQEWVTNYHTTLVGLSTITLAKRGHWAAQTSPEKLLPDKAKEAIEWGEMMRAFNSYEIPKALAILDSNDPSSAFSRKTADAARDYLARLDDSETGFVGFWTDEILAARSADADDALMRDLSAMGEIARSIVDPVHV